MDAIWERHPPPFFRLGSGRLIVRFFVVSFSLIGRDAASPPFPTRKEENANPLRTGDMIWNQIESSHLLIVYF